MPKKQQASDDFQWLALQFADALPVCGRYAKVTLRNGKTIEGELLGYEPSEMQVTYRKRENGPVLKIRVEDGDLAIEGRTISSVKPYSPESAKMNGNHERRRSATPKTLFPRIAIESVSAITTGTIITAKATAPSTDRKRPASKPVKTDEQFLAGYRTEFEDGRKLAESEPTSKAFRRYGAYILVASYLSIDQLEPVRRSLRRVCEKHHFRMELSAMETDHKQYPLRNTSVPHRVYQAAIHVPVCATPDDLEKFSRDFIEWGRTRTGNLGVGTYTELDEIRMFGNTVFDYE